MEREDDWQKFLEACLAAADKKLLTALFELLLTQEERAMISSRYLIIELLRKGELSQREIAEQHGVSIAQITRGSNALKKISPELELFLSQLGLASQKHS